MGSLQIVWKVLLRTAFVLLAAFELFGCAAPTALTVAGIAADGASLAASGKSLSDRALSAATGSDCSAIGMLDDGVLCRDRIPTPAVRVANEVPPLAGPPAPAPQPAPVDNSEATFLALGAYPDWENADHIVVMGRFYNPLIVPLETDAKGAKTPAFWVVAGRPLVGSDGKLPVAQAKSIGFKDARTIALCRATYRPGPCATEEPDMAAGGGGAKQAVASADARAQAPTALLARPGAASQLAQRPSRPDTDTLY